MPKIISVDISRKQFTQILVAVPDDYNEFALWQAGNRAAIKHALEQVKYPYWENDEDDGQIEVECFDVLTEDDAKGYQVVDITEKLDEVSKHWAEQHALLLAYQKNKVNEQGTKSS